MIIEADEVIKPKLICVLEQLSKISQGNLHSTLIETSKFQEDLRWFCSRINHLLNIQTNTSLFIQKAKVTRTPPKIFKDSYTNLNRHWIEPKNEFLEFFKQKGLWRLKESYKIWNLKGLISYWHIEILMKQILESFGIKHKVLLI